MAIVSIKNKSKSGSLLVGNTFYNPTSYESIATVTLSSTALEMNFTSIPSTYAHLQIRMIGRLNGLDSARLEYNNDSYGPSYSRHRIVANGSSVTAAGNGSNNAYLYAAGFSQATSTFSSLIIDILDYKNTSKNKVNRSLGGWDENGSGVIEMDTGCWYNTNAITSIKITGYTANFTANTTAALYGIKES